MMENPFKLTETKYGFTWGPADVSRAVSDPKWGVVLLIHTEHHTMQVRISPKGHTIEARQVR